MIIQHNIMAMNAYRNYKANTSALSSNLEKLSSGYKINRAGDDAAGLAISEKMRAQITGLEAAQKNVKDGISLVKTAEGAMQEIQDMLNRMDYLATQSANGTYQDEVDRENLNKEMEALKTEINRIADSANFNGIKLLDGSLDPNATQTSDATQDVTAISGAFEIVGDGTKASNITGTKGKYEIELADFELQATGTSGDVVTATIKVGSVSVATITGTIGADGKATISAASLASVASSVAFGSGTGLVTLNITASGNKITLEMADIPTTDQVATMDGDALNVTFGVAGGTLVENGNSTTGNQGHSQSVHVTEKAAAPEVNIYAQAKIDLNKLGIKDGSTLNIGGTTYTFKVGSDSSVPATATNVIDLSSYSTLDSAALADAARQMSKVTNTKFDVTTPNNDGIIHVTEKSGGNIDYSVNNLHGSDGDTKDGDWTGLIKFDASGAGSVSTKGKGLNLQIGDSSDDFNQMKVEVGDMHVSAMGTFENGKLVTSIDDIDILTSDNAQAAVDVIKNAINYVSGIRGDLGAYQNRLEHTANNLSVMAENIQDAESTIRDTDVAEEMMSYVKNNILVQSAQAMLAQANQVPQGVLQLLG